jgi:CBS domain-containing protein
MAGAPDTIGELLTNDVVSVGPNEHVRDALQAMIDPDFGSVVVVCDGRVVGIVTDGDLRRCVGQVAKE